MNSRRPKTRLFSISQYSFGTAPPHSRPSVVISIFLECIIGIDTLNNYQSSHIEVREGRMEATRILPAYQNRKLLSEETAEPPLRI